MSGMLRTFRYPLEPTMAQERVLVGWLAACQQLYNGGLEHRRGAWKRARASITRYDQTRELTQLRADDPEWAAVPVEVLRSALARLDQAFRVFFRRRKSGEKPGYPRFRPPDRYNSFALRSGSAPVGNRLRVPNLGLVKFKLYRPLKGRVRDVRIRRSASRWWVCFVCELGDAPAKVPVRSAVGLDLGLTSFAVLSDGSEVENPRFFRAGADLLARRQRRLATKQRGSENRRRQKLLVAKAHEHVRNQRLDHGRKLAAALLDKYDLVAHEDLAIRGMVHGNLGKAINDAAWGMFIGALTSKAESAGKWAVPVDPRGTSQRCSRCGKTVPKALSEREHVCACGLRIGRDHNAALNVRALALGSSAAGVMAEGSRPC